VDPPYINTDMGHYEGYTLDDFRNLLDTLEKIEGKFMLSTFPSDILREYVERNGWRMIEINMHKSTGHSTKTEVITMNYDLAGNKQLSLDGFKFCICLALFLSMDTDHVLVKIAYTL